MNKLKAIRNLRWKICESFEMDELWVILSIPDVCGRCRSAVAVVAVNDDDDDTRTAERLARSPLVTSEQSVELSGNYHNIGSLKVPIAEAEAEPGSESESESESDSDHQCDEGTSDEEKNCEVSCFVFLFFWQPSQMWLTDFRLWKWKSKTLKRMSCPLFNPTLGTLASLQQHVKCKEKKNKMIRI